MELLLNELGLNIEELGLVTNTMYSISFDGQSVKIGENVVLPKITFSNDFLCCFNLRKTLRCVFTKEKMILVCSLDENNNGAEGIVDNYLREGYRSFLDILKSIYIY